MLGTCRQYIRDLHEAEDVMLHAFMKVFQNIGQFKNEGSLEGWIRRIMIRECISFLRQKKEYMFVDDVSQNHLRMLTTEQDTSEDYQALIDALPKGCRYVVVLSVIEGYDCQEIDELLSISEGTSKPTFAYAKKLFKQQLDPIL